MENDNESVNYVEHRKLELLTIATVGTLKKNNKEFAGKNRFFSLIQEPINCETPKEKL